MAVTRVPFEAFRENSQMALYAHFLKTMPVWLPSANNEWNFIWTTNYLHGSISAYVRENFVKFHIWKSIWISANCVTLVAVGL